MNDYKKIIEQPSLAIIIDCWAGSAADGISSNIVDFCTTNPWVKAVAVSTYSDELGPYFSAEERPWYENTKKIFHDTVPWQECRRAWRAAIQLKNKRSFTSAPIINMPPVDGQDRFQAQNILFLLYYLNSVNPAIRNVYYIGGGWDQCIKWRPVGWFQMVAMNQYQLLKNRVNILTHGQCLYGDQMIPEFSPLDRAWGRLNNNIWLLNQSRVNLFDLSDPNLPQNY